MVGHNPVDASTQDLLPALRAVRPPYGLPSEERTPRALDVDGT
jgi:hypothetical protein